MVCHSDGELQESYSEKKGKNWENLVAQWFTIMMDSDKKVKVKK